MFHLWWPCTWRLFCIQSHEVWLLTMWNPIWVPMLQTKYCSGDWAGQNKNCKNFMNLCHHWSDLWQWSLLATSHDKPPCDGLGGTIKWLTARASTQRPLENQTLSTKQACVLQRGYSKALQCFSLHRMTWNLYSKNSEVLTAPWLPEAHSFHHIWAKVIAAKRVTSDFSIQFDSVMGKPVDQCNFVDVKVSDFLCGYDGEYWTELVYAVDVAHVTTMWGWN